ncbi:MAG: hypothetical protein JO197_15615 [Acidobacteria bacterium]|nr:hypothetical protein [Acidobacteriota bacterium]MBV9475049.1 hypothetical protein [Acidobacteriota bacterium]
MSLSIGEFRAYVYVYWRIAGGDAKDAFTKTLRKLCSDARLKIAPGYPDGRRGLGFAAAEGALWITRAKFRELAGRATADHAFDAGQFVEARLRDFVRPTGGKYQRWREGTLDPPHDPADLIFAHHLFPAGVPFHGALMTGVHQGVIWLGLTRDEAWLADDVRTRAERLRLRVSAFPSDQQLPWADRADLELAFRNIRDDSHLFAVWNDLLRAWLCHFHGDELEDVEVKLRVYSLRIRICGNDISGTFAFWLLPALAGADIEAWVESRFARVARLLANNRDAPDWVVFCTNHRYADVEEGVLRSVARCPISSARIRVFDSVAAASFLSNAAWVWSRQFGDGRLRVARIAADDELRNAIFGDDPLARALPKHESATEGEAHTSTWRGANICIVGRPGIGKSTTLYRKLREDLPDGIAIFLEDQHYAHNEMLLVGQLAEDLTKRGDVALIVDGLRPTGVSHLRALEVIMYAKARHPECFTCIITMRSADESRLSAIYNDFQFANQEFRRHVIVAERGLTQALLTYYVPRMLPSVDADPDALEEFAKSSPGIRTPAGIVARVMDVAASMTSGAPHRGHTTTYWRKSCAYWRAQWRYLRREEGRSLDRQLIWIVVALREVCGPTIPMDLLRAVAIHYWKRPDTTLRRTLNVLASEGWVDHDSLLDKLHTDNDVIGTVRSLVIDGGVDDLSFQDLFDWLVMTGTGITVQARLQLLNYYADRVTSESMFRRLQEKATANTPSEIANVIAARLELLKASREKAQQEHRDMIEEMNQRWLAHLRARE